MKLIDFYVYVLAVLVSGTISIPFSAMIARKQTLLVFLLPLALGVLALIFYLIYWTNPIAERVIYSLMGLYAALAVVGSLVGTMYIIIVRKYHRI